jgi:prepilin-type N-terminal cleavage/methylation domain-containing protein
MKQLRQNGFSMIEVVIITAIIGVSAAIAIPNYQQWVAKEALRDGIMDVKGALQIARVNAMARGVPVVMGFGPNRYAVFADSGQLIGAGPAVTAGTARNGFWNCEPFISAQGQPVVFGNPCVPTEDELARAVQTFKAGVTPVGNPPAIAFLSSGRRSVPNGTNNTIITLQDSFGNQRFVTVTPLGDIQ